MSPTVLAPFGYVPPAPTPSPTDTRYDGWYYNAGEPVTLVPIETVYFTNARGDEVNLTTQFDVQYKEGVDGRYMPPSQHLSEAVPEQDGERYRSTRILPRSLVVPVTFVDIEISGLRTRLRKLTQSLNPKLGLGRLTVITEDGLTRYVNCIYERGMESSVDVGGNGFTQTIAFSFRAFDPFWYESEPIRRPLPADEGQTRFFPAPPFRVGASTVFGVFSETNDGDAEGWPVWSVTGPGESLRLVNETTGSVLSISQPLQENTTLQIDTRPGIKSVRVLETGQNWFPYMSGSLWPVEPGENVIRVEMVNTRSPAGVVLEYSLRYLAV